ncbi:Diacylglycerol O-acyltransferase [Candidatus Koribacter versatilis Ellin345]|uniref:diacylglycerol O-acyltransferase n=1 Tax=Koribacter versatilis (strain Ellin345) TaxID=204669 RepID=Q1IUT8_KORVE|nr:wax ester/triacylglycerol synthase domain-containing protein [Candidatus Koribacter versatilis]ABF39362.1 Diacylglycerol O-acyltransferase [Candidatus Koribacter versatilis Ellin345]
MESSTQREYLSFGDALFLHLEREGIPINIASVAIFEGNIRFEELLPYVEAKLSQVPRCMQRVVEPPFNIGLPCLEYDPEFDFRNHVHETTLKHGTDAELKEFAGKLFSENLDRNRPLWDFFLVRGLKRNRTALIARIHHSMADGMSGVAFLNALMDTSPEVPHLVRKKLEVPVSPPRDPATTLLDSLTSSWFLTVQRLLNAQSDILTMARQIVRQPAPVNGHGAATPSPTHHASLPNMDDLSQIFPEIASAPERMPFNVVCKGPQNFDWCDIPFDSLRAVKNAFGCSFNDVALAAVTATFAKYAEYRGADLNGRSLRIVVPVNTRPPEDDRSGMGNEITFVPVAVPLDIRDPKQLIAAAHQRMTMIKQAKIAEMVMLAGALISAIPSPVQVLIGPLAAQLPLTLCNLIFTNVPGPRQTLYVLGHRMLKAYPYVPIGGEMGANCALLTYDGYAYFGFSCDSVATPEHHLLPKFLHETVAEFRAAFGLDEEIKPRVNKPRAVKNSSAKKRVTKRKPRAVKTSAERVQEKLVELEREFAMASD